jgi:hypothetical protein
VSLLPRHSARSALARGQGRLAPPPRAGGKRPRRTRARQGGARPRVWAILGGMFSPLRTTSWLRQQVSDVASRVRVQRASPPSLGARRLHTDAVRNESVSRLSNARAHNTTYAAAMRACSPIVRLWAGSKSLVWSPCPRLARKRTAEARKLASESQAEPYYPMLFVCERERT